MDTTYTLTSANKEALIKLARERGSRATEFEWDIRGRHYISNDPDMRPITVEEYDIEIRRQRVGRKSEWDTWWC